MHHLAFVIHQPTLTLLTTRPCMTMSYMGCRCHFHCAQVSKNRNQNPRTASAHLGPGLGERWRDGVPPLYSYSLPIWCLACSSGHRDKGNLAEACTGQSGQGWHRTSVIISCFPWVVPNSTAIALDYFHFKNDKSSTVLRKVVQPCAAASKHWRYSIITVLII